MADGKTHAAANVAILRRTVPLAIAGGILGAPYTSGMSIAMGAGMAAGVWVGWFCTPDIDHHATTIEEIRIRRINPVLGLLWQLYWTPYQLAIPHRSRWSHAPVIPGTLIRFVYLLWLPLFQTWPLMGPDVWFAFWSAAFAMQSVQDIRHAQLDKWKFY